MGTLNRVPRHVKNSQVQYVAHRVSFLGMTSQGHFR